MMATINRSRTGYLGVIALVIALGLLSRHFRGALPPWMAKNAGDVLWAVCVYLVARWLRPTMSVGRVALAALLFAYAIEFSQLYHTPWLDAVRHTPLGLILGYGFAWSDLLCYTLGITLAVCGEWVLLVAHRPPAE